MINLTELEQKTIKAIIENDFYEEGFDSWLWNDCFIDRISGVDAKQARALLVTLDKKGYLEVTGGKDGSFKLLQPAKDYLLNCGLVNENGYKKRIKQI